MVAGATGVVGATGGTYGALVETVVECVAGGLLLCDEPPELWLLPPFEPALLCSVVGLCPPLPPLEPPPLEPPLWLGFLVGFLVGCAGGGAGGGAATVGATVAVGFGFAVGVFWVGAAAAGEETTTASPDPAALWGHQATRQAARPSNAATAKRTTFAPVLLTMSS